MRTIEFDRPVKDVSLYVADIDYAFGCTEVFTVTAFNGAEVELDRSETTSVCPFKGDATYYSIQTKSTLIKDAGWSYETPKAGLEDITGHLAFFPSKAAVEQL